jgi:hypothetical protein
VETVFFPSDDSYTENYQMNSQSCDDDQQMVMIFGKFRLVKFALSDGDYGDDYIFQGFSFCNEILTLIENDLS